MSLYVAAYEVSYEGETVVGVYSTEEAAWTALASRDPRDVRVVYRLELDQQPSDNLYEWNLALPRKSRAEPGAFDLGCRALRETWE